MSPKTNPAQRAKPPLLGGDDQSRVIREVGIRLGNNGGQEEG
ncbi:MAG: hypothetical protein JWL94_1079 [Microbacteriaceae bacterium]|jgi:hypothetical protein|nr:hypothetical protein [Microbacteriaceae bacterium]